MLRGLAVVIPPAVATVVLSPFLILEVLLRVLADSSLAITAPAVAAALAAGALVLIRRDRKAEEGSS